MSTRVTTAVQAIYDLETMEDLYAIYDAIKMKQTQLANKARRSLVIGDNVSFHSRREGQIIRGVCTKVNRKTASVKVMSPYGVVNYKVPLNMLEKDAAHA